MLADRYTHVNFVSDEFIVFQEYVIRCPLGILKILSDRKLKRLANLKRAFFVVIEII